MLESAAHLYRLGFGADSDARQADVCSSSSSCRLKDSLLLAVPVGRLWPNTGWPEAPL